MFVTPAYAQTAGGGGEIMMSVLPFVLIFVIMYFLIIRPQRQQAKARDAMLAAIRRNDTIVTGGGVVGKVTKVIDDGELEVEIATDTKVRVVRSMVADVRVKGEPAKTTKPAK
ncbi:MAG: preprotein translocase subunit YajC [Nitratireductor sp.]|nr:preprotein translocase subunit YajC [Nitratireductor sp.]